MNYTIIYEPEAFADLEKLSQTARQRMLIKLTDWQKTLSKSHLNRYPIIYLVSLS